MTRRINPFTRRNRRKPGPTVLNEPARPDANPKELSGCVLLVPCGMDDLDAAAAQCAHALKAGQPVVAVSTGSPAELAKLGAEFLVDVQACCLPQLMEDLDARALILPEDNSCSSDLGRRLAAQTGRSLAVRVVAIDGNHVRSATSIAGYELEQAMKDIILVDRRFSGRASSPCVPEIVPPAARKATDLWADAARTGIVEPDPAELAPEDAEIVAAAGSGVTDLEVFNRFAELAGAATGASRNLVDTGRMPRNRQIGTSGVKVQADLYMAFGISGAVQHLEGIAECRRVIAINTDPSCPMTQRADTTLVGDATRVLRAACSLLESHQ